MRPYEMGDPDLDERIRSLATDADTGLRQDEATGLVEEMIVTALKLLRDDATRGDLKLINAALKEMRYSFLVFSRYRETHKLTMFGSARTPPDDPNYRLAAHLAQHMVDERGWMVVTGAGPGIMEAGSMGAGEDYGFGVKIRLPFEAEPNPYIHSSRLVNFKYFFTRKLIFMKESHAFALFPGGFGTLDETFELVTLIQTGKSDLHPIVLIEAPGTGYWDRWLEFVHGLEERRMILPDDLRLFCLATSVEEAAEEICRFYANYHSQRYVSDRLVLRLLHQPTEAQVAELNEEFPDILAGGVIEAVTASPVEVREGDVPHLPRLSLHFDRRSFGRLRAMIDHLNDLVAVEEGPVAE
jgi:uncharacterized protein (TIGR00730 family)